MNYKLRNLGLASVCSVSMTAMLAMPVGAAAAPPPLEIDWGLSSAFTRNFNPFSTSKMNVTSEMYEPLFYFDPLAPKVEPLLGIRFAWSNHNTVLTAFLRKNVKWSNGSAFTAKDVVFTFAMLKKYPQMDTSGVWTKLASVTSPNSYTVTFHFKTADVPFDYYVLGQTPIVPKAIWGKLVGNPLNFLNSHPVVSGPYVLKTFSTQEVTMTPNMHYWAGKPKVPVLKVPIFTGNTAVVPALQSGAIGWGVSFEPNIQKLYVAGKAKYYHYWYAAASPVVLMPNLTNSLLKQLVVRRAISEAINRQKLNRLADSGYQPPANPTLLSYTNADQARWIDRRLPKADLHYQYNPRAAVRLLTNAGFKRNRAGVFISPKGKPLSFTLLAQSGYTNTDAADALIASELATIGIHISVITVTPAEAIADEIRGNFQLVNTGVGAAGPTPYTMYNNAFGPLVTAGNYERWESPLMQTLLKEFSVTTNLSKERSLVNRMEMLVATELPVIGLSRGPYWYEYSTKHYVGFPTPNNPYAVGSLWAYPAAAVVLSHLRVK